MRKIRILLDYRCYPIWVFNEKGELMCNDLPDELRNDVDVQKNLEDIQRIYESLFIDNAIEFRYKGFDSEVKKSEFLSKLSRVMQLIELKVGNIYKIENRVNLNEF